MWSIDKSFTFEAGHRVWAQKLDRPDLSIVTECACKHLHGHSYTVKIFLTSGQLDQSQMVTDFKNLGFMKEFLDSKLDHKFILDINDPFFKMITGCDAPLRLTHQFTDLIDFPYPMTSDEIEYRKSFVLVDFVPTSENICRHLKEYAQGRLSDVAVVSAVELWETAKSHCRYE